MVSTSRLTVFNDALRELGGHPLVDDVTASTSQQALAGAFDHAVQYVLAQMDWNFARRRAVLSGIADTSYPPFTYRYARPTDYLRKCWIKSDPADEFQIDHTESGILIYGFVPAAVIEFISDTADNYNPARWPPHFSRVLSLYLALLVAPKIGRTGDDDVAKTLWEKLNSALSAASGQEAVFATNKQIAPERIPVIRRALEILGQQMTGAVEVASHVDQLRLQIDRMWTHSVRFVLEQGAWNFATKRTLYTGGADANTTIASDSVSGIIEGYSVHGGSAPADMPVDYAGFEYGYPLPDDFRHKIWIKSDAGSDYEVPHQIVRDYIFTNYDPCVLEYIAEDEWTVAPEHWPATFLESVATHLALSATGQFAAITQNAKVNTAQLLGGLEALFARRLADAKNKDAIQQQPRRIPTGSFVRARMGGSGWRR